MSLLSFIRIQPNILRRALSAAYTTSTAEAVIGSKEHIDSLVKGKKLVLFMKGTPDNPRCGFSNAVLQILRMHGVQTFDAHNVLDNEELRQGRLHIVLIMDSQDSIPNMFLLLKN